MATVCVALLCWSSPAAAGDAVLYRIFLTDGTALVSYGEYARVGTDVVFSMPLGGTTSHVRLQVVTLPDSRVDWPATERYALSARADHYARTRGEVEFTALAANIARTLNEARQVPESTRRVGLVQEARRRLYDWSGASYGYRADDVRQLEGMLDEVESDLRAGAGESRFDLSLVAIAEPPPASILLPPPTLQQSIEQALAAAGATASAGDRVMLLRAALASLDAPGAAGAAWAAKLRATATGALKVEQRLDVEYASVTRDALASANAAARRADPLGVEAVIRGVIVRDDRLGRKRPQEIGSLLAAIDARLDAARQLRLARDRWEARIPALRTYRQRIALALTHVGQLVQTLDRIRSMAGPAVAMLNRADERLSRAAREVSAAVAPPEMALAHALLASTIQLATSAVQVRREAAETASLDLARNASSAAAGSLMLLERTRAELETQLRRPVLPDPPTPEPSTLEPSNPRTSEPLNP
jgi:hypothetical protein